MQHPSETGSLPRREFLRRSSLGVVALAGLRGGMHAGRAGSVLAQLARDPAQVMPSQPVAAIAVLGRTVVAIGGVRGDARVWIRSDPHRPWAQVAGPESFPEGTALTCLAVARDRAVAVGCSGPEHHTMPAAFSSDDLRSWPVEPGIPSAPGVITGIAFSGDRGLAVGSRYAEPDVEEPVGTIAFRRGLGRRWVRTTLHGVRPVRHGAITLLSTAGDRLILGLTDVLGPSMYSAPGVEGPWRHIGAPRAGVPIAPVAAASVDGSTLLAGIDARDQARFWRLEGWSWIEVDRPTGVGPTVKVRSLRRSGEDLLIAGSQGHAGFLREVELP